jgi:hypothetical protein
MAIWTMVKYRPLEGCVDKFLDGAKRLEDNHPDKDKRLSIWLKTEEDHVIQITARKTIDQLIDNQDYGLDWLDSVDHLLEKDSSGSRTESWSAYEVDELRRVSGLDTIF